MPTRTSPNALGLRRQLWRPLVATVGGALGGLAYPTFNIWPLIFVSLAAVFISIHGVGFWRAYRIGLLAGLGFYVSGIYWISLYLGPEPLVGLAVLESLIFALGLAATASVWRWLSHRQRTRDLLFQAFAIAIIWAAREWVSTHLPYGGFPWSRAAQALSEPYLNRWAYLGGISWLSFATALVAALLALCVLHWRRLRSQRRVQAALLTPIALFLVVPALFVPPANAENGTLTVAGVQGNAKAGLFANEEWGSILQNHLDQTNRLVASSAAKNVDVMIWPENAADLSPLDYPQAAVRVSELVDRMNIPLIFGTQRNEADRVYNSSVLWLPGVGPAAIYDKKRPVPFAEYVPDRPFWYSIAPDLIGLIQRGYTAGTRSGIFEVQQKSLGVLICFEIAIDEINRELVDQGAQLIVSQTNNADFGHSAETYQQAALAKLQAIATGRAVVNVSTVGVSAIFMPDGSVANQLPAFKAADFVAEVPLRTSKTPAQLLGVYLELALNLSAAALCLLALLGNLRRRRETHA